MSRMPVLAAGIAALVCAGTAAAATAPTATTGPVTATAPTTATVSGSVNPNGTATTWYVEFGTSTSYGSKTASTSAGAGTTAVGVSPTLTGLQTGTSYHYRVVATSSAGTARGADGILTTASAPAAVTSGASGVGETTATLNGSVNPSGRATTWYFEYGTSTSYGTKTAAQSAGAGTSAVSVSAPVANLATGRTYHFRLVATSDAGTSRGSDHSFTPSTAPAVTTKNASSISDAGARLNGTVDPNGTATTAYFEYGTSTSYGSKSGTINVGSGTSARSISASVASLPSGTYIHFRLVATNASGTRAGSDVTLLTTGRAVVKTGAATSVSDINAMLTGSVDSNGHGTTWYFQYGTTSAYGQQTPAQSQSSASGAKNVSAAIGSLTAGTTYHYRLVATNSAGTNAGADTVFTTAGPRVKIALTSGVVVNHNIVMLTGNVASGKPNESVAVFAQRYASGSFASVATVLTDAGGNWQLAVRPTIGTTYKAMWNGSTSSTVAVSVRPAVTLRRLKHLRFATHVAAGRSFAGRTVQLQRRLADGRWRTISRARLNHASNAVFRPVLKNRRSTLRIAISVNQAGAGYLAGFSRLVTVRR